MKEAMNKGSTLGSAPSVEWFFNDWHGGTTILSRHQKGCYMDLLHAQFNNGHLSIDAVKNVLGNDFAVWGVLSKKFTQDGDGNYYNMRLDMQIQKKATFIKSRKKNLQPELTSNLDSHVGNGIGNGLGNDLDSGNLFSVFIQKFNSITGKRCRGGEKEKKQLSARIKEGFTIDDVEKAIKNCSADAYHVENPHFLTPEFILRNDKLEKYLNYQKPVDKKKIIITEHDHDSDFRGNKTNNS